MFFKQKQYSAGNRFQGAASFGTVDLNIDWGVLWQDYSNNLYYSKGRFSYFDDPYKIPGSTSQYCINGNTQMSSDLAPGAANDPMPCSSVVSRSIPLQMNTNNDKGLTDIELYPNPASNFIVIKSHIENPVDFNVYDLRGCIIQNGSAFNGINNLNIEYFNSGIYIFKFSNGYVTKIVVSKE